MSRDPYRYFRIEAHELLEQLGRAALDLEREGSGPALARLLRLAHTLKGAARVVKQREIADLAHGLEGQLTPHRESGQEVPQERIDTVLKALDSIGARLARLPGPPRDATAKAPDAAGGQFHAVRAEVSEVDALLEGLGEVHGELAGARRVADGVVRVRGLAAQMAEQLGVPAAGDAQRLARHTIALAKARSIGEELDREIVRVGRDLAGALERIARELGETRKLTERLRLVPAEAVFSALERFVRDSAHASGKRVVLQTSGADIRMDGHVLEAVQPALVQLVRNAVAHGIEPEEERVRAGKAPEGRIALQVALQRHRVTFRCSDDGRGVDLEAVRRALEGKGALPPGTAQLGSTELLRLLLKGGLTTSSQATELAGRGIGLEVVREIVDRLGGEVSAQTSAGLGTTVELQVPVSLASIEALVVEAGSAQAAIPLEAVRAALRISRHEVVRAPEGDAITHEGRLIPLLQLASCLGGDGDERGKRTAGSSSKAFSAVLAGSPAACVALAVNRITGVETVTLRQVPALAPAGAMVAGLHFDAAGNPRPVLDPAALADPSMRRSAAQTRAAPAVPPILVVDDSLTTRMLEQSILESAGYEVALATSGEQALEMARRGRYALFLVDVEMPGMDGFTFLERSRADPKLGEVPCVIVTSRDSAADRDRGRALGASGYIVKSEFDQAEFLGGIARLVQR